MKLFNIFLGTALSHSMSPPNFRDNSLHIDQWPPNINNIGRMFQTMEEHPDPVKLEYFGRVPKWLAGSFYRNGPGKYEFGNATFEHFFDPSAIIQQIEIRDHEIFYNSKFIRSRNYVNNGKANTILYPEVGTWAEAWDVGVNEDGTPIQDPIELGMRRCEYMSTHFPTDNTDVSVIPVHGWLLAMTESTEMHLIDPITLDTVKSLDFTKAKNLPEGIKVLTITAHGHLDQNGDYWNMGGALDMRGDFPKVVYFTYVIRGAGRSAEKRWADPVDPDTFLDLIEFSENFAENLNPMDMNQRNRYFHMFSGTQDYLVLPLNSVAIEPKLMVKACMEGQDLVKSMKWDPDREGEIRIFSKKEMKFLDKVWLAPPFFQVHMIQAYECDKTPGTIHLDTMVAGHGDVLNMYYFDKLNLTGQALHDRFHDWLPVSNGMRYSLDLNEDKIGHRLHVTPRNLIEADRGSPEWSAYFQAGSDFPVLNFEFNYGKPYNHLWSAGFGSVVPDRIYHTEVSSGKKWVWRPDGYSPSEPFFVSNPMPTAEDDGVVVTLASPMSTERDDLEPFFAILNGRDLTELARAYLPKGYTLPVGFHGIYVQAEKP